MAKSQCILGCKDAAHYFEFPSEDIIRNLWLYSLGMDDCDSSAKLCNKHFSEGMVTSPYKLEELAIPDTNLPTISVVQKGTYKQLITKIATDKSPPSKSSSQLISNQDSLRGTPLRKVVPKPTDIAKQNLLASSSKTNFTSDSSKLVTNKNQPNASEKQRGLYKKLADKSTTQKASPVKSQQAHTNVVQRSSGVVGKIAPKPTNNSPVSDTTNKLITDASKLLMDYQLRVQGKYICDVIEVPEFVVVLSVAVPKERKEFAISTQTTNNLKMHDGIENTPSASEQLLPHAPQLPPPSQPVETIEIEENDNSFNEENDSINQVQKEPEIDFVYYMTGDTAPRREREVQTYDHNATVETAVQCDVQLDNDMTQMAHYSQLWMGSDSALTDTTKHECLECGEVVISGLSKMWHAYEHQQTRVLCAHCGEMFSGEKKLKKHEKEAHPDVVWEIRKAERCPKMHCNKAFHSRKQLLCHIDDHLLGTFYKCNRCRRIFHSALKLHSHQKAFTNCARRKWPKVKRRFRII